MRKLLSIFVLGSMLAIGGPALAKPAAKHRSPRSAEVQRTGTTSASELSARMTSIEMRIAMLRDRHLITRDEALDLRDLSRSIERRLYGMSPRDVSDLELGIDRLESRVNTVVDNGRWSVDPLPPRNDNMRDWDRYERDHPSYHHQVDRYTGTPGDRWFDPFDDDGL